MLFISRPNPFRVDRHRRSTWPATGSLVAAALLLGLFYRPVVVQGKSMLPSLRDGQVVWMDRQHYRLHEFRRGDVVIFRYDSCNYVKRVYARGGDSVKVARLHEGGLTLLADLQNPGRIQRLLLRHPRLGTVDTLRVPAGHLFVVGDNRANSVDSRDFGPIPESSVIGYIPAPRPAGLQRVACEPPAR